MTLLRRCVLTAAAVCAAGCHSIGPRTIARDRFDYSSAISESWKRQTLLNIVKLRYLDPPIFVDVGQIISAYSLETSLSLGGGFGSASGNTSSIGVDGTFTDRPTVTYQPLTGDRFISGLMTPLPPESLLLSIQSGWAADVIFTLGVAAVNGIHNGSLGLGGFQQPDAQFVRVAELMRSIQQSGAIAIEVRRGRNNEPATLMTFRVPSTSPQVLDDIRELRDLLGLDQTADEFQIVHGELAADDRTIAIRSRSLLHAITALSMRVHIPEQDVADGRAIVGQQPTGGTGEVEILSSAPEPHDAFVSVNYRNHWFYVDDRNLATKRAFGFVMLLFTLADTSPPAPGAVLTIPAQ